MLLETDFCFRRSRWSGSPLYYLHISIPFYLEAATQPRYTAVVGHFGSCYPGIETVSDALALLWS